MLPAPTVITPGNANALFQTSGTFSGSHFVVDAQNNSGLANFGGIIQVPLGPFPNNESAFTLYVDGRVVAGKIIPYAVVNRCFRTGSACWALP